MAAPARGGTGDVVLETRGLTKRFGEFVAVDGVDLAVERGEFRSVIGPNGAGKTTLFNLVSGPLGPTSGQVFFDGREVTDRPAHERIRMGIARSFQLSNVFRGLTVRENVRLAAQSVDYGRFSPRSAFLGSLAGFPAVDASTDRVLEQIGLDDRPDVPAGALSYGDQRRLEIGLVLATDPELVLLDEPTAGMSGEETERTIDLVHEVLADKTLVLVEHDIDIVMEVSDAIAVLHQGRLIADGTPEEISADEGVQRAYLGGHA